MDEQAKANLIASIQKQIAEIMQQLTAAKEILAAKKGINYITVHHTAGNKTDTDVNVDKQGALDGYPKSSLGHTMAYHYFIDWNGAITHAREDTEFSQHARGVSKGNIGICLAGNFMNYSPSLGQLNSLKSLLDSLKAKYYIDNKEIHPHSYWNNTACPGAYLKDWLNNNYV
jgi:hypothetical protein